MTGAFVTGIGNGAILALIAVGIVLVYKGSKVLNLAQGEIGLFALFLSYVILGKTDAPAMLLALLTVVLGGILGIVTERVLIRPLVERPPIQSTIVTLGLAVVLINAEFLNQSDRGVGFLADGLNSYPTPVPKMFTADPPSILGAPLAWERLLALILTFLAGLALYFFFTRTKFGLGVVAATSDNTVARILGIPVKRVYLFTWGVGGMLSGLGAAIVGNLQDMKPGDMTIRMIAALAAAVIGGLDSVWGAIVGGLLVGVVTDLVGFQTGNAALGDAAVLTLVILTLMLRPQGLLGGAGADA